MNIETGRQVPTQWPDLPQPGMIEPLLDIIAERAKIDRSLLQPGATMESLAIPSLDMVEILFEVEEKFDIYIPMGDELSGAVYLADVVDVMADQIQSGKNGPDSES